MPKLIRITTVPMALRYLLPGQMRYMKDHGFDVIMISADGKEREEIMTFEGCPHLIVPMTRKITPLKDLSCLWQLIKIFRKERPDIVHSHTPKAGLLGMLAAKLAGVKVRIHTVAGMPLMVEKGFKLTLLKQVERLTYGAAGHVWPNSFSLLSYIKANRFTKEKKLKVISKGSSNGINLQRFNRDVLDQAILEQVKQGINYNPAYTYLLCIGRLVQDKGISELVQAFLQLQQGRADLKLLLVGQFENELDPLPIHIIDSIKNNVAIIHIPWTTQVEYYLALANIFVFPSHREGFPNVLLQAGALKLPVIASSIPGNIDIIDHGKTGLIFPAEDVNAICQQIAFALGNPALMMKYSEKLEEQVKRFFSQENMWQSIHTEYVTLLNKNAER